MKYILIKLGGSLITDKSKPLSLRKTTITQLATELSQLHAKYPNFRWIIGNGAGSFGHYTVHKVSYKDSPADPDKILAVRKSVMKLNEQIVRALVEAGLPAVTVMPHEFIFEVNDQLSVNHSAVLKLLEKNKIPVVYGDVIDSNDASRIIPTEEILETIGLQSLKQLGEKPYICIYATSVDGVLDKNGKVMPKLSSADDLHVHKNHGEYDVTGGMAQKVKAALTMAKHTEQVYILNGYVPGEITKAVSSEPVGTRLEA